MNNFDNIFPKSILPEQTSKVIYEKSLSKEESNIQDELNRATEIYISKPKRIIIRARIAHDTGDES